MNILITSSNTNSGKTFTTLKLIREFTRLGFKVGVIKPIETGVTTLPTDGLKLLKESKKYNKKLKNITLNDVVPIKLKLPAAPYVAKKKRKIDFNKIMRSFKKIEKLSDIVLIESAGGILTPIEENFFVIDFVDLFNAKTIFITSNKLGMISESLVNIEYLKQKKIDFIWAININKNLQDFNTLNKKFLSTYCKNIILTPNEIKKLSYHLLH